MYCYFPATSSALEDALDGLILGDPSEITLAVNSIEFSPVLTVKERMLTVSGWHGVGRSGLNMVCCTTYDIVLSRHMSRPDVETVKSYLEKSLVYGNVVRHILERTLPVANGELAAAVNMRTRHYAICENAVNKATEGIPNINQATAELLKEVLYNWVYAGRETSIENVRGDLMHLAYEGLIYPPQDGRVSPTNKALEALR